MRWDLHDAFFFEHQSRDIGNGNASAAPLSFANSAAEDLNAVAQRVAGMSMDEIDSGHSRAGRRARHDAKRGRTCQP
jgi:hypothetical protein